MLGRRSDLYFASDIDEGVCFVLSIAGNSRDDATDVLHDVAWSLTNAEVSDDAIGADK